MLKIVRRAAGLLADFVFPLDAVCMGCASPLGVDDTWLCDACLSALLPASHFGGARCPVCSRFSPHGLRCKVCRDWAKDGVSRAYFVYRYAPPVDKLIHRFKYGGVYRMSSWMAMEMKDALYTGPLALPDALVAVPMHKARLRARGFNQAQLLADHIGAALNIPVLPALTRTRNTKQQARLGAVARHKNLLGAIAASDMASGLRVLLIDDVLTTGSTAEHCARALLRAGAADVQLLTFAAAD